MVRKRHSKLHESVTSKSKLSITVTPTTWQNLTQIARKVKLSKSALVEGVAKGKIAVASTKANLQIDIDPGSGVFNQINGFSITPQETELPSTEQAIETISAEADRAWQNQLAEKNNLIEELHQQLQEQTFQLEQQNQNSQSWQQQFKAKDEQIQEQSSLIHQLRQQLQEKQSQLEQQNRNSQSGQQQFKAKDEQIQEQSSLIHQLRQQLQEKQSQLEQQNRNSQSWQQQFKAKDEQIQEQSSLIHQLNQESREQLNESSNAQVESNKLKVRITIFVFIVLAIMVAFLLRYYYSHM
jgi:DNA repair ATPase RecN